jgi:SAM-dependent methyltransferase
MASGDQVPPAAGALRRLARRGPLGRLLRRRASNSRRLYLDLLERAVTHTLYFPPDTRQLPQNVSGSFKEEFERAGITELGLNDQQRRNEGRDWPVYAQTMIGRKRTRNVRQLVERVISNRIPGDLIEAGCWRGGTVIMMRGILKAHGIDDRTVFAADSFQGLPEPDPERFPADSGDINYTADELAVSLEEVRGNLRRYGLDDGGVEFLEGWFRDTLPTVSDRTFALVRLDGDLYESTMDGLTHLYPALAPGGFLIVDDYGWENCRQAVEDYRSEHSITAPIERIDWVGAWWQKPR